MFKILTTTALTATLVLGLTACEKEERPTPQPPPSSREQTFDPTKSGLLKHLVDHLPEGITYGQEAPHDLIVRKGEQPDTAYVRFSPKLAGMMPEGFAESMAMTTSEDGAMEGQFERAAFTVLLNSLHDALPHDH